MEFLIVTPIAILKRKFLHRSKQFFSSLVHSLRCNLWKFSFFSSFVVSMKILREGSCVFSILSDCVFISNDISLYEFMPLSHFYALMLLVFSNGRAYAIIYWQISTFRMNVQLPWYFSTEQLIAHTDKCTSKQLACTLMSVFGRDYNGIFTVNGNFSLSKIFVSNDNGHFSHILFWIIFDILNFFEFLIFPFKKK